MGIPRQTLGRLGWLLSAGMTVATVGACSSSVAHSIADSAAEITVDLAGSFIDVVGEIEHDALPIPEVVLPGDLVADSEDAEILVGPSCASPLVPYGNRCYERADLPLLMMTDFPRLICAVTPKGPVRCSGRFEYQHTDLSCLKAQMHFFAPPDETVPNTDGLSQIRMWGRTPGMGCGTTNDGDLRCWGTWHGGSISVPPPYSISAVELDLGGVSVGRMCTGIGGGSSAGEHRCFIDGGGSLRCFGFLRNGEDELLVPETQSAQLADFTDITACAVVRENGASNADAWYIATAKGVVRLGRLVVEDGALAPETESIGVQGPMNVNQIVQDRLASPALLTVTDDGEVWAIGWAQDGPVQELSATRLEIGSSVLTVSALDSWGEFCFVSVGGEVACTKVIAQDEPNREYSLSIVDGITNAVAVVGQWTVGCALERTGAVQCWTNEAGDQLLSEQQVSAFGAEYSKWRPHPRQVEMPFSVDDVAASGYVTCALGSNGGTSCWGQGAEALLPFEAEEHQFEPLAPFQIPGTSGELELFGARTIWGGAAFCILEAQGNAWCWGDNTMGSLGAGVSGETPAPLPVDLEKPVAWVERRDSRMCAKGGSGTLKCWGSGIQTPVLSDDKPGVEGKEYGGYADVTSMAIENTFACVVHDDGQVSCQGSNKHGQLGVALPIESDALVPIAGLEDVVGVTVNHQGALAWTKEGAVFAWGGQDCSWFGNGAMVDSFVPPSQVDIPAPVQQVVTAGVTACALTVDGHVYCWGGNLWGEAGEPTLLRVPFPQQVFVPETVTRLAAGGFHVVAVDVDGGLWTWGDNQFGQLGIGKPQPPEGLITVLPEYSDE